MRAAPRSSHQGGVTLVELTVAVMVIAILFAIGIPAWRHHVLRLKSTDAARELLTLAQRLDACRKRTGNYFLLDDARNPCVVLPYPIAEGTYQIGGEVTADAFLLTATPIGSQTADMDCSAFTIDHLGHQGVTGTAMAQGCWGDHWIPAGGRSG